LEEWGGEIGSVYFPGTFPWLGGGAGKVPGKHGKRYSLG